MKLGRVRWMICRWVVRNWLKNATRGVSTSGVRHVRVSGATERRSVPNAGSAPSAARGGGQG